MALQKISPSGSNGSAVQAPAWTGTIFAPFPTLCEFLAALAYPDGTKRQTGTLQLFTEHGVWKATLRDKDSRSYAFLSGQTVEDLFLALETALDEGKVEWRADKPFVRK